MKGSVSGVIGGWLAPGQSIPRCALGGEVTATRSMPADSTFFQSDSAGHLELDTVTERGTQNHFFAGKVIGREFAMPAVQACDCR
jgi:hypothetical protein